MDARTYCAPTMAQALAKVKLDLGRDAVILFTRNFRRGGLFGIGGRAMWEVTASAHVNVPRHLSEGTYVSVADAGRMPLPTVDVGPASFGYNLTERMGEIHQMVSRLVSRSPGTSPAAELPEGLAAAQSLLSGQDVSQPIADELLGQLCKGLSAEELRQPGTVRRKLAELIAARIPIPPAEEPCRTSRPKVMVLIGPTGVGKTTTIAKLAARFTLQTHRKVGLVTIDTYRIAAVDQLKTFAQLIGVPLRTVLTPAELAEAIDEMSGRDVVLVDTAGRSPGDSPRLRQMQAFLEAARPDEVHLVVAATAGRACAERVLANFMPLGANRVIMSKLDEAATFGTVLNVACSGTAAFSYVTTGQEVPDDIAPADAEHLAGLLMAQGGCGG